MRQPRLLVPIASARRILAELTAADQGEDLELGDCRGVDLSRVRAGRTRDAVRRANSPAREPGATSATPRHAATADRPPSLCSTAVAAMATAPARRPRGARPRLPPRPAAPPTGCSPRPPPETLAPTRCAACRTCSRGTRFQGSSQTWCKGPKDCNQHGSEPNQIQRDTGAITSQRGVCRAHLNLATNPRHASSRRGAYRVRRDPNVAARLRRVPRSASWHP